MKNFNERLRVLVVDDELEYREVLQLILSEKGYTAETCSSGDEALQKLNKRNFDLVLTDLFMEGLDGIELLRRVKMEHKDVEVIIISGYGTIKDAVKAMKEGAFTYFIKSHDPEELLLDIEKIKRIKCLQNDNEILRRQHNGFSFVLETKNEEFQKAIDIAEKAADSNVNVLILGESGVGKEVLARHVHNCSSRKGRHFMAVNCHAFADNLLESELFGHEKGAFTGAIEKRKGRFEAAHGGTLFLDEIGDIPLNTQAKLLRTIETKKIERIGSNHSIETDFRLISATNKNLNEEIIQGRFRDDLFYRISTITIEIPPLRERKEDLDILIEFFLEKSKVDLKKKILHIEKGVKEFLYSYNYPGNIRELKNIIERLVVLSENGVIRESDLPKNGQNHIYSDFNIIRPLRDVRKEIEQHYIAKALQKYQYNISETARKLQISRRQLTNKINEYGLK